MGMEGEMSERILESRFFVVRAATSISSAWDEWRKRQQAGLKALWALAEDLGNSKDGSISFDATSDGCTRISFPRRRERPEGLVWADKANSMVRPSGRRVKHWPERDAWTAKFKAAGIPRAAEFIREQGLPSGQSIDMKAGRFYVATAFMAGGERVFMVPKGTDAPKAYAAHPALREIPADEFVRLWRAEEEGS